MTSCELKLRSLAIADATMLADFGPPTAFRWFDRQLVQGDIGAPADAKTCVTVQRVSTIRQYNQGGLMPLSQPRFQINVVSYSAERARQVAADVATFFGRIDLTDAGDFTSVHAPAFLLNQRPGMLVNVTPPAYVETLDYRIYNREDLPD